MNSEIYEYGRWQMEVDVKNQGYGTYTLLI